MIHHRRTKLACLVAGAAMGLSSFAFAEPPSRETANTEDTSPEAHIQAPSKSVLKAEPETQIRAPAKTF